MAITVEKLEIARRDFERNDANHDGLLTADEYRQALKGYGVSDNTIDEALNELDPDHNGEITWFEFLVDYVNDVLGRKVAYLQMLENLDKTFKEYDTNNDGKASAIEITEALKNQNYSGYDIESAITHLTQHYDIDEDREITWNELFISLIRQFEH
ncbi:EF-hand domain-containing protein [Pseudomonas salmasensis]|uniref:EF-hand domain-containing protein n=1 Tax=Pseudomonas salmasensis TaxID=2745514 RepID=A0ABU5FCV1_9PSED|nr:EF-hand domain-containing protein [Pseudomonas salmasensis]MDY4299598.1 EF-hand domain-containing protein [Pseudomonas salmasensis]QXH80170.1 EF-hand domain-containing protein [Pseudomonas salmasensis]